MPRKVNAGGRQRHRGRRSKNIIPMSTGPAVIGGIVLASAISLVLLTFGSAVGLSFANFRTFTGVAPVWVAIAAASWLLWVQISSFMAGGYLAGRMRRRFHDASEHESDVRDGAHGLLVWAGALVVGAMIAVGGIGAAANAVGSAASTLTNAASNVAQGAAANPNGCLGARSQRLFHRPAVPLAGRCHRTCQPTMGRRCGRSRAHPRDECARWLGVGR